MLPKTGILYFATLLDGFDILRHVDPFVRILHIYPRSLELFSQHNYQVVYHRAPKLPGIRNFQFTGHFFQIKLLELQKKLIPPPPQKKNSLKL